MRLSDLRVGARLGCAFGLLLLLMLGMGLYALHKVEQVQASVVDLSNDWLPSTQQLAGVNEALNQMRRGELQMLLGGDAAAGIQDDRRRHGVRRHDAGERELRLCRLVVEDRRVVDAELLLERLRLRGAIAHVDADEVDTVAELGMQLGQHRRLDAARRAGGVPEVDERDTVELGRFEVAPLDERAAERLRSNAIRERELGHEPVAGDVAGVADLARHAVGGCAAREREHGDDGRRERGRDPTHPPAHHTAPVSMAATDAAGST